MPYTYTKAYIKVPAQWVSMGHPGCINTFQRVGVFMLKAQKLASSQTPEVHHSNIKLLKKYKCLDITLKNKI